MALEALAAITVRGGDTIGFGTARRFAPGRIGIIADSHFGEGDFVEFQLELCGWERTVAGIAEIIKAEHRPSGQHRYLLRVLEMMRSDRTMFQAWYDDRLAEGQEQADAPLLDSRVGSRIPSRVGRELPRPRPSHEDEPLSSTWGTDRALSVSRTIGEGRSRRQALRAVLRAACDRPSRAWVGRPLDARQPPLEVELEHLPEGTVATLRYHAPPALQDAWNSWLEQGLAFIPHTHWVPSLEQPLWVRLLHTDALDLSVRARVVVVHATGFGVTLDLDPPQHQELGRVARGADVAPRGRLRPLLDLAAELPASAAGAKAFWARIFALDDDPDPLEEALGALPDPLAPMCLEDPADARQLAALLARADEDYLVLCDRVAALLSRCVWRWPELEERCAGAPDPMATAAAFVVLAHICRVEAVAVIRDAAAGARARPSMVTIQPRGGHDCPRCRVHHGLTTTPAALVRQGLPPFHLGCECQVVLVAEAAEGNP